MTSLILGADPTIQAATFEEMLAALIRLAQIKERDTLSNPNRANNVVSSANEDTLILAAQVNLPCICGFDATGKAVFEVPDYFNAVSFTFGTGSELKSSSLPAAIVEVTLKQRNLELLSAKNPTAAANISYSINTSSFADANANATFSATYNLPLQMTQNAQGATLTVGAAYLL